MNSDYTSEIAYFHLETETFFRTRKYYMIILQGDFLYRISYYKYHNQPIFHIEQDISILVVLYNSIPNNRNNTIHHLVLRSRDVT